EAGVLDGERFGSWQRGVARKHPRVDDDQIRLGAAQRLGRCAGGRVFSSGPGDRQTSQTICAVQRPAKSQGLSQRVVCPSGPPSARPMITGGRLGASLRLNPSRAWIADVGRRIRVLIAEVDGAAVGYAIYFLTWR